MQYPRVLSFSVRQLPGGRSLSDTLNAFNFTWSSKSMLYRLSIECMFMHRSPKNMTSRTETCTSIVAGLDTDSSILYQFPR